MTPIWTSDAKSPSVYTYDKAKATLTMKLLWSSAVKTYVNTPLEAGLPGVFQIKSTSSTKVAQIDFAGVLIDDPTWFQNQDGAMVMEIKVAGQVDAASSLANAFKISISNGVSALT